MNPNAFPYNLAFCRLASFFFFFKYEYILKQFQQKKFQQKIK